MDGRDEKDDKLILSEVVSPEFPGRVEIAKNIIDSISAFMNRPEIPVYLDTLRNVLDRIAPPLFEFASEIGGIMQKVQAAHKLRSDNYPKIVPNLDCLATKTWFVSLSLGLENFEALAFSPDNFGADEEDDLNKLFIRIYQENLEYLEGVLVERFPSRAFAICPAIEAHRNGLFALSVPIFLSQADGILLDITSAELFTSHGHISAVAKMKMSTTPPEDWFGHFDNAAWSPLSVKRPVGWSRNERAVESYSGFNRNTVMHGMDLNYASELNSFKSFSLLSYIASIKEHEERDEIE